MRATTSTVMLLAANLVLCGCATIRGFPERPRQPNVSKPDEGYQLGTAAITAYNAETDADQKKLLRNEIIDARMAEIDSKFADYERSLYKGGVGWGVGTDWAILSLTAATTIVGATKTKTALGAISTAFVGAQADFDKRALFDKTLPALMAQMVAEREKIRAGIRASEGLPVASYTWFAADTDLSNFEFAGSIPGAISAVSLDAGQKAATASQKITEITQGKFQKDDASTVLRKYWKPDGTKIDDENQTSLKTWMSGHALATSSGDITMFLYSADFAGLRAQAVKDLKLGQ